MFCTVCRHFELRMKDIFLLLKVKTCSKGSLGRILNVHKSEKLYQSDAKSYKHTLNILRHRRQRPLLEFLKKLPTRIWLVESRLVSCSKIYIAVPCLSVIWVLIVTEIQISIQQVYARQHIEKDRVSKEPEVFLSLFFAVFFAQRIFLQIFARNF